MDLTKKKCKPCEGGVKPFTRAEALKYIPFAKGWKLGKNVLTRDIKFKDFNEALQFVNKVGKIAESEGHHPDISIYSWNNVALKLDTHAIRGLSINDFILAAKINKLLDKGP